MNKKVGFHTYYMDADILERLLLKSETLKQWAGQFTHKRYLFDKVKGTSADFYCGVRGMRGIGKTVMLLQLAREMKDSAYFSADASYLRAFPIHEIADALRKKGMKAIFIDEIHTRPNWRRDLKTLYDEHELRIYFSGSSSLKIKKTGADLSRRAVIHELKPVSLREYLNIQKGFDIPKYSIEQILKQGKEISLKHLNASEYIAQYMRYGGVLYSGEGFNEALENSIQKTITIDLAALREINIKYESDAYKLLYHISVSKPFEASYSSLAQKIGISKAFAIRLVHDLESAGFLKVIFPCRGRRKDVKKEPKIFLSVPFRRFFTSILEKGSLREEFFVGHAPATCYFKNKRGEKTSDFLVGKYMIEIGGFSKTFEQKPDYIAVDSALWEDRKIPLFLFGLTY